MKRRSYSDVPEVANRGNTANEIDAKGEVDEKKSTPAAKGNDNEEVANGDADDVVDRIDSSEDEFRVGDAYANLYSMMEENPVRDFRFKSSFQNALDFIKLLEKYYELKRSQADEVPSRVILNVGCYMVEAARELENAEVRTEGEKMMVEIAQIGIKDCIRTILY